MRGPVHPCAVLAIVAAAAVYAQSSPMEPTAERPLPADPTELRTRILRSHSFNWLRSGETLEEIDRQGAPPPPATMVDFLPSRPALPGDLSDTIFVGAVASAQAYLSENRCSIYTEVTVWVQQILAQRWPHLAAGAGTATLLLPGGSLKLPNGRVLRYEVRGTGDPLQIGSRYVFFCIYSQNTGALTLTKAWLLAAGKAHAVAPDDVARAARGATTYDGMSEAEFLAIVKTVTPSYRAPTP